MKRRTYELVLRLLPPGFREEFGREMTQAFIDSGASLAANTWSVAALAARLRADQWRIDLRHAARGLMRQKTFTITAVTTLALALGPATAVFSLINGVLLDPIPGVQRPDRVVFAWAANPALNRHEFPWSELNFSDHRARKSGLSALGAFTGTAATIGGDTPQQVQGAWVSEDIFDVLGVAPARGRRFTSSDMEPGAPPTIVLGHDFARARFGDRDPIGQTLMVDERPTNIIGVLPENVRFPAATPNFWQPLVINLATTSRSQNYLRVIGRLADGATIGVVEQQMNAVALGLEKQFPESNTGSRVELAPAAHQLTRGTRRIVTVVGFAAAAIFLLACTNIASLLVVRTAGRQSELAMRTALGASAARLSRQLVVEHLLLAALASVAAIGVAAGLLRAIALTALVPPHQIERATLGPATYLFLIALMSVTAVSLGWIVSRRATRTAALAAGPRAQTSTRDLVRLRQALVSVEVGAAVVLLVAAGLLLRSASRLVAVDPGFEQNKVITFKLGLPPSRYQEPAARTRFIEGIVERLVQLPGVDAAASGAYPPMTDFRATRRFAIDGDPIPPPGSEPLAIDLPASPSYAAVLGLRMVSGRWISERDRADSPPVVVISESFARQYFPDGPAIGRRLRYYNRPGGPPLPMPEIVGVVSDVRQFGMAEATAPQMYVPHAQRVWTLSSFFVRTSGDPRAVVSSLAGAVHGLDRERPLEDVQTLAELVSDSTSDRRALGALLAMAAVVALLISTVGVYGVTAAATAARRRELAIRAAMGADRAGLMALVVRQGLTAAVTGVVVGLAAGLAASSLLESVLYEVEPRDPVTLAAVGLILLAASALATYVPARRAVTVTPADALKEPA
jgi:putative ABC transport system permease protein